MERPVNHIEINLLPCLSHSKVSSLIRYDTGASLVAQWLGVCLPVRGTRVRALVWRIPHAAERLGPWATITEPARLEPVLRNRRGRGSERPAHRDEGWPPLAAAREGPRTGTKTQHSRRMKNK